MTTRSRRTRIETDALRFQELRADLAHIEYFSKGTLLARMIKCGKPNCPCGADPQKRHGPYFEWTYKEQGKTVNVRLTAKAAPVFQAASKQYRKLKGCGSFGFCDSPGMTVASRVRKPPTTLLSC